MLVFDHSLTDRRYTRHLLSKWGRCVVGVRPAPAALGSGRDAYLPLIYVDLAEQEDVVVLPVRIHPNRRTHNCHRTAMTARTAKTAARTTRAAAKCQVASAALNLETKTHRRQGLNIANGKSTLSAEIHTDTADDAADAGCQRST